MSDNDISFKKVGYSAEQADQAMRVVNTHASHSDKLGDGKASATAPGFKGDVTVTVEVEPGTDKIQNISIDGDTEMIGNSGAAIEKLQKTMNEQKALKVDTITGATVTSQAVFDAADYAYKLATGKLSGEDAKMKPGRYETEEYGSYIGLPIKIGVTVSDDAIESVDIDDDNLEIGIMLRAVKNRYVPRVLKDQALAVDAISGATVTSNAVRMGIERCVKDAYAANGAGPDAAFKMLKPQESDDPEELQSDYYSDVLVVGMGGSGISAALSAAEAGASVIAIDKAGKYGGTTCVTSESCAVNPKRFDAEFNDGKDYVDAREFEQDWASRTHGDHKQDMLDLYFEESGKTIDWLMFDHDFPYNTPNGGHADYAKYDCCFTYKPYTLADNKDDLTAAFGRLMDQYTEFGGKYFLEMEALEFLHEGNKVTGVKARRYDGHTCNFHAKSVIIGTGGFGCNRKLMKRYMTDEYFPLSGRWHAYGMMTNDGKMIEGAIDELGAGVKNPSVPPLSHLAGFPVDIKGFGTHVKDEDSFFTGRKAIWSEGDIPTTLCVAADSLAVTREGKRFINEQRFATHGAIVAGPEYYTVWSQEQLDVFKTKGLDYADYGPSMGYCGCRSTIPLGVPLTQIDDVMAAGIRTGNIHKADSIEELAKLVDMDPQVLCSTVDAYNAACDAGEDAEFGKDPQFLDKVGDGPYYAVMGCAFFYTTAGALDVNTDIQVLDKEGQPIEGLYAVGTDSMGVLMTEKEQYLDYGGAASGWALTSGRLAGKAAAKHAAEVE